MHVYDFRHTFHFNKAELYENNFEIVQDTFLHGEALASYWN